MVVTAVHTAAVAVAPMVVLVVWAALAQSVLSGPVHYANFHLITQAIFLVTLTTWLLLVAALEVLAVVAQAVFVTALVIQHQVVL
jgi:hypothetical protein